MAKNKVIGIKADSETISKFDKIQKDSNKDWLEDKIRHETEKEKISIPDMEKPEKFITIPASEYEQLMKNAGPVKHGSYIFDRVVRRAKVCDEIPTFDVLFSQLEAFWNMNGLILNKRKDGSEWVIDCEHGIGKSFSKFFYEIFLLICQYTNTYELYDKKILENSLVIYLKKNHTLPRS